MSGSIGNVGELVAIIRSQLSAGIDPSTTRSTAARKTPPKRPAAGQETLEEVIGKKIGSINRDDPNRGKKAFRIFLETILLSHFGDQLMHDPKFHQLVNDIQISMEADPEIRLMIDSAIAHLVQAR